ncbi:ribosomal RNA small subunit methyltransferase A [Candidatus Nomurabacteria bacterium]|nr:ribosomal RNA small subunit methyltransferase A [Candidatus Nomurabacteria bacterium]
MNLEELQFLFKKYKISPNHLRGQNFLLADDVLEEIIDLAEVSKTDLVLEVGPGLGALTQKLLATKAKVVAFEVDRSLEKPLANLEKLNQNLELIWQDILSLTDQQWQNILFAKKAKTYKVVANIPYYLTGKLIGKFILSKNQPSSMTLMVQREVAERVVLHKQKHSLLSLSVAFYGEANLGPIVKAENFYPVPKVDSAILQIKNLHPWNYQADEQQVWQLIHRGMAAKRKKLINNLLSDPSLEKERLLIIFEKIKIDKNSRAEDLAVEDWLALAEEISRK